MEAPEVTSKGATGRETFRHQTLHKASSFQQPHDCISDLPLSSCLAYKGLRYMFLIIVPNLMPTPIFEYTPVGCGSKNGHLQVSGE